MQKLSSDAFPSAQNNSFLDVEELVRFVVTGIVATIGNLSMVWLTQPTAGLGAALVIGICTGLAISFILSKLYAFRSHSWEQAHLETMRFLIVYACGAAINWTIGYLAGHYLLPALMPAKVAGLAAALLGAGSMAFTSYFGHRFFTYKTSWRNAQAFLDNRSIETRSFHDESSSTKTMAAHSLLKISRARFAMPILSIACFGFLLGQGSSHVVGVKRMLAFAMHRLTSGHAHIDIPLSWVTYSRTVILLDYGQVGFIRRGLGGTLANAMSRDFVDGAVLFSMVSLFLFCVAATLIVMRVGLQQPLAAAYMALVIGLSQQTFGLWRDDLARTDLLVAACLAWAALATMAGYRAIGAAVVIVGCCVHETAVIFGAPLLLVLNAADVAARRLERRNAIVLGLCAVSVLACLVAIQGVTSPSVATIRDAMLQSSPPQLTDQDKVLRDIAVYMATSGAHGLGDALCFNFAFNRQYVPMALSGLVVLLAYVFICLLRFRILAALVAVLTPYLFLSVVAMDVGRWVSLGVCTAWLLGCFYLSGRDTTAYRPIAMLTGALCFFALLAMGPTTFNNVNTTAHNILVLLGFNDSRTYKEWLDHCDPTWRDRVYNRIAAVK